MFACAVSDLFITHRTHLVSFFSPRGWKFTPDVDDAPSECDLDEGVEFDLIIENDGEKTDVHVQKSIDKLVSMVHERIEEQQNNRTA